MQRCNKLAIIISLIISNICHGQIFVLHTDTFTNPTQISADSNNILALQRAPIVFIENPKQTNKIFIPYAGMKSKIAYLIHFNPNGEIVESFSFDTKGNLIYYNYYCDKMIITSVSYSQCKVTNINKITYSKNGYEYIGTTLSYIPIRKGLFNLVELPGKSTEKKLNEHTVKSKALNKELKKYLSFCKRYANLKFIDKP